MKRAIEAMVVTVVLALGMPALAQFGFGGPGPGPGGPGMDPARMEKHKAFRGKVLREKIGLSEEKAVQVELAMEGLHQQRMELHQTMMETMQQLEAMLAEESDDQQAYGALLDTMKAAHDELQGLQQEEMEKLRTLLTPKEQARMIVAIKGMKHHGKKGKRGWGKGGHPDLPPTPEPPASVK